MHLCRNLVIASLGKKPTIMRASESQKTTNVDFLIAGNDNPRLLAFGLDRLGRNYPDSAVYLYDWGYRKQYLEEFGRLNSRLEVIRWPRANVTSFMYNKILCIKDYYDRGHRNKMVYMDSDVIVCRDFSEVFTGEWDVGAIWRPDYNEYFGTEQWLNGGTVFFNDCDIDSVRKFVELWKARCDNWEKKDWWLDQVELVRMFSETDVRFRDGCDSTAVLQSGDSAIRLRTFGWYVYNFYPGAGYERPGSTGKVKIVHLKSRKRKQLFNLLPGVLVDLWFQSFGRRIFGPLCDLLFRGILNAAKAKDLLHRKYLAMKYDRDSEIYYWKVTAIRKRPLYDFAYFRANEIMKIFYELNGFEELNYGKRVIDIGPGPCGGVLDVIDAEEKWTIEPGVEEYKKNNIWMAKSIDLTVRSTTAEDMSDVPEDYFDSVFAINSIDHGDDIRCCFNNVYKVLKNGGSFYLHVHCRKPEQTNPLHRQSFTEDELRQMLAESGFTIYKYGFYDEDPLSSTYNTFIGICRKG